MAVSFISAANAEATTLTMPTHAAGDLLMMFCFRDGALPLPTVPSGWTQVVSGQRLLCSATLAYKIAASGSETSGTWTSGNALVCHVYRGAGVPGATTVGTDSTGSATILYPPFTNDGGSSSWVAAFGGNRSVNGTMGTAPTGMTNRTNLAGAGSDAAGHDTNGGVASWAQQTVASGETASGYITLSAEIPALGGLAGVTYDSSGGIAQATSSGSLSWGHNVAGGGNAMLLAGLGVQTSGAASTYTRSVTCAGSAMTSLGVKDWNNGTAGFTELFAIRNPAVGANTISVTITGGTPTLLDGASICYLGVGGFSGSATTAAANTTVNAVTVVGAGSRVVAALAANSSVNPSTTAVITRASWQGGSGGTSFIFGELVGTGSTTISYPMTAAVSAGIGVSLMSTIRGRADSRVPIIRSSLY